MHEPSLVFPAQEYRDRVMRLQARMAAQGVDALLLTTAADVFYVSGFLTRFWESPARPWFVIVPQQGDPVAVIPSIGAPLMRRTWLSDIRTWDAPDPRDDGISLLCDALAEKVPAAGSLGLPMGLETQLRMPLADYALLCARLAPRTVVDAADCLQRVREVKSAAEIAKIRDTCAIAGRAFERVRASVAEGRLLSEVFRDFQIALLSEGADWVSYVAGGAGPDGYLDVISPAGPQPLRRGDVLMLDTGAVKDGYFCDFDRNLAIGAASDTARRAHAALWAATEDVLAAIRPGWRASDVHAAFSAGLRRRGFSPSSGRLGHGLGVTLTRCATSPAVQGGEG